ncbi:hypothetical protein KY366_03920 [Candidatus Woesearchaeota archaeon]|nr:hypothetical protein [Candidatus Woesearchaeota archaeon]
MGKRQSIKSLANSIALVSVHKILVKYTNKPESKKYLEDEVDIYSLEASEKSEEYSWKREELKNMELRAIRITRNKLINKYPDISLSDEEVRKFVIDSMQELSLQ